MLIKRPKLGGTAIPAEKNIMSLGEMPERYRRYGKEPWLSRGLRIIPVDNYCVFYIPDAAKRLVSIMRVMRGSLDIDTEPAKHTIA